MAGTVFREALNDLQREGLFGDAQQIEGKLWYEISLLSRHRITLISDRAVPEAGPGIAQIMLT